MIALDHVVHAVHDLDSTAATYSRLGFVVTPRADHPFGTSNRLVVVEDSYIEIVAVTDRDRLAGGFAPVVADYLAEQGEGIPFLVLSTADAEADHRRIVEAGITAEKPFMFSRPAPLPDGSTTTASFTTVFLPPTPFPRSFFCAHHTPEAIWNPAALAHPNRVARILAVTVPSTTTIERLAGSGQVEITVGPPSIRFDLPIGEVEVNGVLLA